MNDDIEKRVFDLVAKQLQPDDPKTITRDSRFSADLGADSLDLVEMIMAIEEAFGIEIPEVAASKIVTISDAITYIENELKKAA